MKQRLIKYKNEIIGFIDSQNTIHINRKKQLSIQIIYDLRLIVGKSNIIAYKDTYNIYSDSFKNKINLNILNNFEYFKTLDIFLYKKIINK